jgi:hypothetical protein
MLWGFVGPIPAKIRASASRCFSYGDGGAPPQHVLHISTLLCLKYYPSRHLARKAFLSIVGMTSSDQWNIRSFRVYEAEKGLETSFPVGYVTGGGDVQLLCFARDFGRHMKNSLITLTPLLHAFCDQRFPAKRVAQDRNRTNLSNLTTIATFFSAVTATTLQMSYQTNRTGLDKAVNASYFASLTLSVAAALSSVIARAYKEAS